MPAAGYRSLTVRQELYEVLKDIAKEKNKPIAELVEMLIELYHKPYVRAFIDEVASSEETSATKPMFEEPFHDFVLDRRYVKHYESTSWIRTEDYIKKMHDSMLGPDISKRIREDDNFKVEKIFILTQDSWNKREVLRWIAEWAYVRFLREKQVSLFVLKEKTAKEAFAIKDGANKEKLKYYDMGIYKLSQDSVDPWDTVGYLAIDEHSSPGPYKRVRRFEDDGELRRAERYFAELQKNAQPIKNLEDIETLQTQSYD